MLFLILLIFVSLLLCIYITHILTKNLDYWKKRGVKYIKPLPLFGNMLPTVTQSSSIPELVKYFYNAFPDERYVGIFQFITPTLLIRDPELIKSVSIKNFDNFADHTTFFPMELDPLWGKNLFATQGDRWRDLRQTLTPVFTSSKMRTMFVLMEECAKQLVDHFKDQDKNIINIELKDIFTRFTTDVIANAAFGIKCNSLKQPNNEFLLAGRSLANFTGWKRFKFLLYGSFPKLAKFFNVTMIDKQIGMFFRNIIDENIRVREKNGIVRPDLIHLLMLSRKGKLKYESYMNLPDEGFAIAKEEAIERVTHNPNYLSNEDITAQAIVFFLGGYDTASSLMSFTGYELAINPTIQKKLREEIVKSYKACGGNITYELILGIKYLDMVVSETLRKWPQGPWIDRKCTKAFEIEPEREGESLLKINVGDLVWFPAYGLHMDPKYFPKPEIFDPERFSDKNSENINSATYMPFGIGPRNCIGSRFALLESKTLLYHLLLAFEFVPTEATQIPLKLKKDTAMVTGEKQFHLGLKRVPML